MARALRPGQTPLTPSQVELINSGFRPGRHGFVVRLVRRLVWPLVRPFQFYVLEQAERARAEAAGAQASALDDSRIAALEARFDGLRNRIETLPASIGAAQEARIEGLNAALGAALEAGIDGLRNRVEALAAAMGAAQQAASLMASHRRLLSEVRAIGNRHAWVEEQAEKAVAQIQVITGEVSHLAKAEADRVRLLEHFAAGHAGIAATVEAITARLAEAESACGHHQQVLESLIADDHSAGRSLRALENGLATALEHGRQLAARDIAVQTSLSEIRSQLQPLQSGLFLAAVESGIFLLQRGELISETVRLQGAWDAHVVQAATRAAVALRGQANAPKTLLAIDVGAHFGLITVALAHLFDRVISFEPNAFSAQVLRANVLLNGLAGRVDVRREALAAVEGTLSLAPSDRQEIPLPIDDQGRFAPEHASNLGAYSFVSDGTGISAAHSLPLDSLQLDEVSFIKIDVQGGDGAVLMGAMQTIARCRPWLVFEWEDALSTPFGVNLDEVRAQLAACDYQLQVLKQHNAKQVDYLAIPALHVAEPAVVGGLPEADGDRSRSGGSFQSPITTDLAVGTAQAEP